MTSCHCPGKLGHHRRESVVVAPAPGFDEDVSAKAVNLFVVEPH